jgi:methionyl-tRNA formyltransferase
MVGKAGVQGYHPRHPQVMLLGTPGDFSAIVLRGLLDGGARVCAVVAPGAVPHRIPRPNTRLPPIPVAPPDELSGLAEAAGVPMERVSGLEASAVGERLARLRPDVVLSACFPFILPRWLLALPRQGCLNLHPSLLPAYRGPAPLFWQLRAGERRTGITLHRMSAVVDAGDIVARRVLALPAGAAAHDLSTRLAALGVELVEAALVRLGRGQNLVARSQREEEASSFPWPEAADFEVPTTWSAERAFRFMAGTRAWGQPYRIVLHDEVLSVRAVRAYMDENTLPAPLVRTGDEVRIRFGRGVLRIAATDVLAS